MARVFISYCRSDRELIRKVAADLEAAGHQVWWDTQLVSGTAFRDVIDRELDAADAVIVIWTPSSNRSSWVVAEADHAMRLGKLIPMVAKGIEAWQIPKPYGTLHAGLATDQEQVLSGVQGFLDGSMVPTLSASNVAPLSRDTALKAVRAESQMSTFFS